MLLDRRGDRLLDRERVGARIRRRQVDLRRQNLRKLRDRQAEERHRSDEDRQDGDDHRHDGPPDEKRGHLAALSYLAVAAGAADALEDAGSGGALGTTATPSEIILDPLDDDALTLDDALVDDAQALHARPNVDPAQLHLVVGSDDADGISSLHRK